MGGVVALAAKGDAVVGVPGGGVPFGVLDGDGAVTCEYLGERSEVVDVEGIAESGVGAAMLARPSVAAQNGEEAPFAVRGKATDRCTLLRSGVL